MCKHQRTSNLPLPQLQHFEERYTGLQMDLVASQEKQKQALQELSAKEEEMVLLRVELTSLQEKYKAANDEVSFVQDGSQLVHVVSFVLLCKQVQS